MLRSAKFTPPQLYCLNQKAAKMFCTNQECKETAYLCFQQSCSYCQFTHLTCKCYRITSFFQQLNNKIQYIPLQVHQTIDKMHSIYDDCIKRIQEQRIKFDNQVQWYGLSSDETQLVKQLTQNKQINGQRVACILKSISNRYVLNSDIQYLNQCWNTKVKEFDSIFSSIKHLSNLQVIKIDSVIIQQSFKLQKLFLSSPISKIKLLYRASQNNYSSEVFHQKCNYNSNTITLVRNDRDQILGFFNPNEWSSDGSYQNDIYLESFLFSLTHDLKWKIGNHIRMQNNTQLEGPCIGDNSYQFYIPDNCQLDGRAVFNPKQVYQWPVQASKEVKKHFSDEYYNAKMKITQWEVFQIQFIQCNQIDQQLIEDQIRSSQDYDPGQIEDDVD